MAELGLKPRSPNSWACVPAPGLARQNRPPGRVREEEGELNMARLSWVGTASPAITRRSSRKVPLRPERWNQP